MISILRSRNVLLRVCSLLVLTLLTGAPNMAVAAPINFQIAAGDAPDTLSDFGKQSGLQMLFEHSAVAGRRTQAVKGSYEPRAALSLLLDKTGLTYKFVNERTVTILSTTAPPATKSARDSPDKSAQSTTVSNQSQSGPDNPQNTNIPASSSSESEKDKISEIVVTGTHIRGVTRSASPVQIYTRADIDKTGLGTVAQFIQTLPQNFNGGASENTIGQISGGGNANNSVGGAGVNLRGLGNDSTVVLVNGHRVAPGNGDGNFVDISMIPLSAVERIEVVTDGASAIYGSDAVGGVINFILREHFNGLETRARVGAVSDGGSHEIQAGQTIGHDWGAGTGLLTYEFYDRTPLSASSRVYTDTTVAPFTLLPEQLRHNAFVSINQIVSPNTSLFAEGTFAHRSTSSNVGDFHEHDSVGVSSYGGTLGAKTELSKDTELELSSGYSASNSHIQVFFTGLQGELKATSSILSGDAVLRGSLLSTSAGKLLYAIGGQFRRETFDSNDLLANTDFAPNRNVEAGFVEMRIPLVGPDSQDARGPRLELSVADRYEHYSDFGNTNNPQIGLIWKALPSLNFRGTAGTSFKAPLLSELNPMISQVVLYPLVDAAAGQRSCAPLSTAANCTNTLIILGQNSHLTSEKARTWTTGVDFTPTFLEGIRSSATYYNIHYKDRITNLQSEINLLNAFGLESILGTSILERNPPSGVVYQYTTIPQFHNFFGIDPMTTGAVLDLRTRNLAVVDTRGLDFDLVYKKAAAIGEVETGVDANYVMAFDNQITAAAPPVSFLNTPYNPLKWKARGRAILVHGSFTSALFVNFVSSYEDPSVSPAPHIASWTTADLTERYECRAWSGILDGLEAILGIQNIANKSPPFVANSSGAAVNFDGANANALGRYFSLELRKRW